MLSVSRIEVVDKHRTLFRGAASRGRIGHEHCGPWRAHCSVGDAIGFRDSPELALGASVIVAVRGELMVTSMLWASLREAVLVYRFMMHQKFCLSGDHCSP
jgi:hypothetical protein